MDYLKTGRTAFCLHCGHKIEEDIDPDGNPDSADWGYKDDYGCDAHPESDEDGVMRHVPVMITGGE